MLPTGLEPTIPAYNVLICPILRKISLSVNYVKNPKSEIPQKSVRLDSHFSMQFGGHNITNSPFPQMFCESTFKQLKYS
jgi:hypothetical protein